MDFYWEQTKTYTIVGSMNRQTALTKADLNSRQRAPKETGNDKNQKNSLDLNQQN